MKLVTFAAAAAYGMFALTLGFVLAVMAAQPRVAMLFALAAAAAYVCQVCAFMSENNPIDEFHETYAAIGIMAWMASLLLAITAYLIMIWVALHG